ncbi:DsbA family protein [Methanoregula sp.]|uniref:DsbA family protein n=1 Tax=Methanoregula sp. TaxID=2052170 RepID=UPI003C24E158
MTQETKPEEESPRGVSVPSSKNATALLPGKWRLIAPLGGIFIILIAFLAFSSGFFPPAPGNAVTPSACGDKVLQFVNANLVQPGTSASLVSVSNTGGIYAFTLRYQSQNTTVFTTGDCTNLFVNPINMSAPAAPPVQQQPPKKSSRPEADLYVMAFCPYGTQAETAMGPVEDLLGSKADIRIRYITTISGNTTDSVQSLHGKAEAQEDLRQVCINQDYPGQLWNYVKLFDEQCYPQRGNETAFEACQQNVTSALNMDAAKITSCATGSDGLALLKADEMDAGANGISGSPTLLVNGVEYSGARTPEAYKEAICNSFDTAPSECTTTLSNATTTNSGGGCA